MVDTEACEIPDQGSRKDLIECRFLSSHHELFDVETNAPTFAFPCELFRSIRAVYGEAVSSMAESGTIADIQVSVRQITQHSLFLVGMRCAHAVHRVCYPVTER